MQRGALCKTFTLLSFVKEEEKNLTQCSHIMDLTPDMIISLIATASYLQIPALRDAICNHVCFRPSIRIYIVSQPISLYTKPNIVAYIYPSPVEGLPFRRNFICRSMH